MGELIQRRFIICRLKEVWMKLNWVRNSIMFRITFYGWLSAGNAFFDLLSLIDSIDSTVVVCTRSEELRRWFVNMEVEFFRYKFACQANGNLAKELLDTHFQDTIQKVIRRSLYFISNFIGA